MFNNNEFDVCTIFYNKFKSVISQEPQAQQIIPVESSDTKEIAETNDTNMNSSQMKMKFWNIYCL